MAARLLPLLVLPLGWVRPGACTDPPAGGWLAGTVPEEPRCTVERADASLTYSLFLQRFAFSRPVILAGVTDNSAFRALCTREKLLAAFGPFPVRLSTANTYSYRKAPCPHRAQLPCPPRHPLLLRGQQLHRVGPPLPALRAPSLPHPGHQPRLQLWDRRLRLWRSLPLARPWFFRGDFRQKAPLGLSPRGWGELGGDVPLVFSSAGFCTHRIKPRTSTPTRRRWPGSSTRTPPCHRPSARWSAPCALGRSCTSLTAGGTPHSTWTPASSSPPSWARTGTRHHHPSQGRSSSSCHPQGKATDIGTNCLRKFWFLLVFTLPFGLKLFH
ncbi:jmjC domain-containing protein 8 isoform X1 [Poecile atricapillus]|uniref:jmjC domain-containing protein 8 isoform X1 n=1 Tax=Poecile atricapillus TaxID=48891 RepID=UPI0027391A8B|nr:jmjC domain-containing protein 8 isoform X1 [Poecile atricapillus]